MRPSLLAVVVLVAALLSAAPAAAACDVSQLKPSLVDWTVTQGIGDAKQVDGTRRAGYEVLARSKKTLVRLFLALPACASVGDIKSTGGSLSLTADGVSLGNVSMTMAPADVAPPPGPQPDSTGDPVFTIPAATLAAPELTDRFTLTVTPTLHYQYRTPAGYVDAAPLPFAPFSKTVEQRQNALNLLVVPLGDPTDKSSFPEPARREVVSALGTVHRVFPFADRIGTQMLYGQGGLRYTISETVLDARKYYRNGLFCADGYAWSELGLEADLLAALSAWNSSNPLFAADKVMGVVSSHISSGCTDGYGSVPGDAAYVRVFPTESGNYPRTGSLMALELAHTFAMVPSSSPNVSGYHSKNDAADSAGGRPYNVDQVRYVASDRSVMKYYAAEYWNDNVTLLEPYEYEWAQCKLTRNVFLRTMRCPDPGTVGAAAAKATPTFFLAGRLLGDLGPQLTSYRLSEGVTSQADPNSDYRLVQRDASGAIVSNTGVAVAAGVSEHTHDGGTGDAHATPHTRITADVAPTAVTFEVWHGQPGTSGARRLYERHDNEPPSVTGTRFSMVPAPSAAISPSGLDDGDDDPSLSPDGRVLAYEDAAGIRLQRPQAGAPLSAAVPGNDPALSGHGWVVYERAGGLLVRTVNASADPPTLGPEQLLYRPDVQGDGPAATPAWSPDGRYVVASIAGDLWRIDVQAALLPDASTVNCRHSLPASCRPLTNTPAVERSPSWSPDGLVAYSRDGDVWTLRESSPASSQLPAVTDAIQPAWGGDHLAFFRDNRIWSAHRTTNAFGGVAFETPVPLTDGPDRAPAFDATGTTLVFSRNVGERAFDIRRQSTASRTAVVTASDETPALLQADFFLRCPTGDHVLAPAVNGTVTGGQATFTAVHDAELACQGGQVVARVNDGVETVAASIGSSGKPRTPTPGITEPAAATSLLQFDAIPLIGSATDPDGPAPQLEWFLSGPGLARSSVGSGPEPAPVAPPAGGWQAGTYTVALRATDGSGAVSEATRTVAVAADADNDGLPSAAEAMPCAPGSDQDSRNAYQDPDRDALPNHADEAPCSSDTNVAVDFEPNVLYVPSEGNTVTVSVTAAPGDLRSVDPRSVRISQVGPWRVRLDAVAWQIDRNGVATAKFDKQVLNRFLQSNGLVGGYVPMVLEAAAPTFSIRGVDPSAPVTAPA